MESVLAAVAPRLRRFALRMCGNPADADDAFQDALLAIATNLGQFEGRSSLPSWAFTLARTACSRRRRGKKNQPTDGDDKLANEVDRLPGPEECATRQETSALVTRVLGEMPDNYREVLLLRDAEGLTAAEAAVVLGVTVDALKSRLHRARAALRDALAPLLEQPPLPPQAACPDVVRALSEKLEGDLDATACAEIEQHVVSCPACTRTCDALRTALAACRASDAPTVSPEVQDQVKRAVGRWLAARG